MLLLLHPVNILLRGIPSRGYPCYKSWSPCAFVLRHNMLSLAGFDNPTRFTDTLILVHATLFPLLYWFIPFGLFTSPYVLCVILCGLPYPRFTYSVSFISSPSLSSFLCPSTSPDSKPDYEMSIRSYSSSSCLPVPRSSWRMSNRNDYKSP